MGSDFGDSIAIMSPKSDDDDALFFLVNAIHQAMLQVDPPRVGPGKVSDEPLKRRLHRVVLQCLQQSIDLGLERAFEDVLIILARLFCKNNAVAHLRSFFQSSSTHSSMGVFSPSLMESAMPGMLHRWQVSSSERRYSSLTTAALPCLVVTMIISSLTVAASR